MNDEENFQRYLNKLKRRNPPRAPKDSEFEEYFKPGERTELTLPPEEDTEIELDVYNALLKHFKGGYVSKEDLMSLLEQARLGYHSDVVGLPEVGQVIYRGMAVTSELFERIKKETEVDSMYSYVCESDKVVSWSTSSSAAAAAAAVWISGRFDVIMVMSSRVSKDAVNDLLIMKDGMYEMYEINKYRLEKEVISFLKETKVFQISES
jgi:hypothetical protein